MKKTNTILALLFCLFTIQATSQTWLPMSNGLGSSTESVKAIAVDQLGNMYVGGTFTGTYNYLVMWDGTNWMDLGSVLNGPVYSIAINSASDIFIGGNFSTAGGVTVNNIVRLSGGSWFAIDSGFNAPVKCIYVTDADEVYAGGQFSASGTSAMNHVSKYENGQWTQLGSGIGGVVNSIMFNNTILYAGTEILSGPVLKYVNNSWSSISGISNGKVYALASFKNNLYVGGDFQFPYYAAARWDGTNWASITTTFSPTHKIYSLLNRKDSILYVGGNFTGVGVGAPNYIGKIDGLINSPLKEFTVSSDLNGGEVYAIGNISGKVIAGGKFTTPATNIAITSTTIDVNEIKNSIIEKEFFPNPAVGNTRLRISTRENLKNPELSIFDLQSKRISNIIIVKNVNLTEVEFSFNCDNLPAGNYFYTIKNDDKIILTDKFVVIKD